MYADTAKAEEEDLKNVLVINSYHDGFNWTHEESEGIIQGLKADGINIAIFVEYMDRKNYNSQNDLNYLYEFYKYKYIDKQIDLVVTTDDAALEFALQNREEIFSNAPVVFCGVNIDGIKKITQNYDNVTGVVEEINPIETFQFALKANPLLDTIYLISDNSESGISTRQIVSETIKSFNPNLKIENLNALSFIEILNKVNKLDRESMVFITTYASDINNKIYDIDYVIKNICKNSSVPVYALYEYALGNGIVGGKLLSGRIQGENAAKLAIRILKGEDSSNIPILYLDSTRTTFDYNQLIHHGISMKLLPKNSDVINKPFSFFETYKTLVLSVLGTFLITLIFISILLYYIKRLQDMKHNLNNKNEELSQLYEELTASDEEMREQYEEMVLINEKIRLSDEKLSYLAYHDSLTGLPNKLSLYEYRNMICCSDNRVALYFVDIDNFKFVNDTLGHDYGDRLLIKISDRIRTLLNNNGTLYRLGGDEFVILFESVTNINSVEKYAKIILDDFSKNYSNVNGEIHISFSIGIAMTPIHGKNLEELLKYSDIAMYEAKQKGKNKYVIYNERMNEIFQERVSIEKYLQKALENNEFELYYQPQLDIQSNLITGFEALLRWNSPELGQVPPDKIIGVSEDMHFIIPLGIWILNTACRFLKTVRDKGFEKVCVSVNISILQLLKEDFIDQVLHALSENNLNPEDIELEITETVLMESFEIIINKLQQLRAMNIKIALDDFGKGYSSLSYLKQLPITTMKIDKSFIDEITENKEDELLSHVISMGKELGMCVVAEGVELENQLRYLKSHNCDKIQGYLFSKPKPASYIYDLLKKPNNF